MWECRRSSKLKHSHQSPAHPGRGVEDGPATCLCKQLLHKDADDGNFSQILAFFFFFLSRKNSLKWTRSAYVNPASRVAQGHRAKGGVCLGGSCSKKREDSCSVIALLLGLGGVPAPQLVGVLAKWVTGSAYQLISNSQPCVAVSWQPLAAARWLALLVLSPIKAVRGCFPSTSTLLLFLSPLLPSFSPSGFFLPDLSQQERAEISAFLFHSTPKVSSRSRASPAAWG